MVEELPRHRAETAATLLTGVLVNMTQMSDTIQLLAIHMQDKPYFSRPVCPD